MKNNKVLSIAVVLLLLTNIALIAFMLTNKKKYGGRRPSHHTEPSEIMIRELNMTAQQQQDFKQLKEEHFKNVRPLFDSVRAAKTAFFALVKKADVNDSLVNVYSNRVCEKQAGLDKITLTHFRQVRNIFTTEQQPRFDSLVQKMMSQRGRRDPAGRKDK